LRISSPIKKKNWSIPPKTLAVRFHHPGVKQNKKALYFDVYRLSTAKQKSHQKTMIFDCETLLLGQNFDFGDN